MCVCAERNYDNIKQPMPDFKVFQECYMDELVDATSIYYQGGCRARDVSKAPSMQNGYFFQISTL